ncbi:MAG: 5-bromo-4-chloroindolyl phosphate hydrolysis family protein [Butyrivibrio sp.]|nr:5-bromo-4-chloroindolyl phosphate hydrolysis family protein [Butyrivibrio sp.]
MDNNNSTDFIKAGSDILNSVTKAIDTNDYSNLASEINKTIKSVSYARNVTYASMGRKTVYVNQNATRAPRPVRKVYPFLQKRISTFDGLALMTMSATGLFFMLLLLIGAAADSSLVGSIVTAALSAGLGLGFFRGLSKFKLAKKFHQYGGILKEAEYFKISDLARVALKPDAEVLKDIKTFIKKGYLPRARLDNTETTCMITDNAYQLYAGALQDQAARELRNQQATQEAKAQAATQDKELAGLPESARAILSEGKEYITYVRQVNDLIPDTEIMSTKLYRLEEIMNRIFEQVKKEPSTAEELRKLMNYYLPTTKKLLDAYVELDRQPETGANITKTKAEIDSVMDTINEAFENLLDNLFQEMAWDISSDISVMKTMMAQDGLTAEGQGMGVAMQAQGQAQAQVQAEIK